MLLLPWRKASSPPSSANEIWLRFSVRACGRITQLLPSQRGEDNVLRAVFHPSQVRDAVLMKSRQALRWESGSENLMCRQLAHYRQFFTKVCQVGRGAKPPSRLSRLSARCVK